MAILDIVMAPADVLRKKAKPVTKINASIRRLLDDMAETMYAAPGVGLAAPQVGISKRIVVLDPHDGETGLIELINPEIIDKEGWVQGTEGCLSIPGYVGDVYRYERVKVVALNRQGHKVYYEAEGWLARIFQHEIDHLDGILYTDKCTNFRELPPEEEAEVEGAPAEDQSGADRAAAPEAGAGAGAAHAGTGEDTAQPENAADAGTDSEMAQREAAGEA